MSGDGEPHVLPLWKYMAVFGVLVVGTFLTVWAARQDFGAMETPVALGIATEQIVRSGAIVTSMPSSKVMSEMWSTSFRSSSLMSTSIDSGIFDGMQRIGRSWMICSTTPPLMRTPTGVPMRWSGTSTSTATPFWMRRKSTCMSVAFQGCVWISRTSVW